MLRTADDGRQNKAPLLEHTDSAAQNLSIGLRHEQLVMEALKHNHHLNELPKLSTCKYNAGQNKGYARGSCRGKHRFMIRQYNQ